MKKNIASLNKTNILSGKLVNLIPEIYELKDAIENNDWHPEESVFNHTLSVLFNLEKIFLGLSGNIRKTLKQTIDKNTRKILLKISAIFHDIAKKETLTREYPTSCPNHDKLGAEKTKKILERFNLSEKESNFIVEIIRNHMTLHYILEPDNSNFQKKFVAFKNKFSNSIYPELILLAFADTIDSGLKKNHPKEYRSRIDFYKREIEKLS